MQDKVSAEQGSSEASLFGLKKVSSPRILPCVCLCPTFSSHKETGFVEFRPTLIISFNLQ